MKTNLLNMICLLAVFTSSTAICAEFPLTQRRDSFIRATEAFQQQEYEKAAQELERLLHHYPELDDYVQFFLAASYVHLDQPQQAQPLLEDFLKRYPFHPLSEEALLTMADILLGAGQYEQALHIYRTLTDHPDIEQDTLYYHLGQAALGANQREEAAAAFHEVIAFYPRSGWGNAAQKALDNIVTAEPDLVPQWTEESFFRHVEALFQARHYTSAITRYTEFKQRYPESARIGDCDFGIADAYIRSGKSTQGTKALEKMITGYHDTQPELAAKALYSIGMKQWNADHNTQAQQTMLRLVEAYADTSLGDDGHYVIARIYQGHHAYAEAAEWYAKLYAAYPDSDFAEEALWRAGWSCYLDQRYDRAVELFAQGPTLFPSGSYHDDSLYWLGRSFERREEQTRAIETYHHLLAHSPDTYYSIRAQKRLQALGETPKPDLTPHGEHPNLSQVLNGLPQYVAPADFPEYDLHIKKALELREVKLYKYALNEMEALLARHEKACETASTETEVPQSCHAASDAMLRYLFARLYAHLGNYLKGIQMASQLQTLIALEGLMFPYMLERLSYPLDYWELIRSYAEQRDLDPFLVAGIIRQESAYNPEALSYADARGLMQLIPSTGKRVAKQLKIQDFSTSKLYDPELNITLGTQYFADLLKRFDGNLFRTIAAYNAGPNATAKWWPENGKADSEEVVENITYRATRYYVKRVLRDQYNYRRIYGNLLP